MEVGWILLVLGAASVGAAAGLYAGASLLRRAVRELQYGLADLEDRLVREVKKRAALARWDAGEEPAQPSALKEELKTGFLSPGEFARRKSERRMRRGAEAGQAAGENS